MGKTEGFAFRRFFHLNGTTCYWQIAMLPADYTSAYRLFKKEAQNLRLNCLVMDP